MITVRRAIPEDQEAIFEFIRMVYQGRWQYKIPERWQWEYVDNPFLTSKELPIYIAIDEAGNVVGQNCILVEPLQIAGREYRVGWSVDLYLLPEYRGHGIGYQLQKAAGEANQILMSLDMSKTSRRLKDGLGWAPVDPVVLYTRLIRYEPESILAAVANHLTKSQGFARKLLVSMIHGLFLDRIAAAILNKWVDLQDRLMFRKTDQGLAFQSVDQFDDRVNQLWEKISPHYPASVKRDEKYLNWKYGRQPFMNYSFFMATKNGEACGYLILRVGKPPERNMGVITDVFTTPDDEATLRTFLTYAIRYFKKARVKDIVAASSIRSFQNTYEALGFKPSKKSFPMIHCKVDAPEYASALEPGSWFLSRGDHDWDQFPLAR